MALEHKSAVGVFLARQDTEAALNQLKNSGFPMDKVSVMAQDVSRDDKLVTSEGESKLRKLEK